MDLRKHFHVQKMMQLAVEYLEAHQRLEAARRQREHRQRWRRRAKRASNWLGRWLSLLIATVFGGVIVAVVVKLLGA